MDKLAKSVLRFMASQSSDCYCSLNEKCDNYADISITELSKAVNANQSTVRAAIAYLVENNFAEYWSFPLKSGSKMYVAFHLKHEGLHYKEIRHLTKLEKWKERLIGFVTAMLLWGLQILISKYIG